MAVKISMRTAPLRTGRAFSIHTGLNEVYRELMCPWATVSSITAGNTTTLTMNMAVDRFFYSDTDTLDLVTEGQSHGSTETIPQAMELTDNVVKSFSVQ
ncbi:MAG: hypothetical protein R2818_11570 [Flavobacteriales bacterium]